LRPIGRAVIGAAEAKYRGEIEEPLKMRAAGYEVVGTHRHPVLSMMCRPYRRLGSDSKRSA